MKVKELAARLAPLDGEFDLFVDFDSALLVIDKYGQIHEQFAIPFRANIK